MFSFDWVSRSSDEHALSHHDRRRLSIDDHDPDISLRSPQCLAPARPKFAPTASLQRSCSGLRLLSLDGGGVRGLLSVVVLEQVMVRMGRELQLERTAGTPKPCDFFDIICGTSTGGLIAVMMGRLHMIIGGSIDAYAELSKKIFRDPRSPKNFIIGSFEGSHLEKAAINIVNRQEQGDGTEDTRQNPRQALTCAMAIAGFYRDEQFKTRVTDGTSNQRAI